MAAEKLDYAGFLETSESLDNDMTNMKKPTLILNSWQHLYSISYIFMAGTYYTYFKGST